MKKNYTSPQVTMVSMGAQQVLLNTSTKIKGEVKQEDYKPGDMWDFTEEKTER